MGKKSSFTTADTRGCSCEQSIALSGLESLASKYGCIRRVTRSYGKGETLLIIENVPVASCPHCGTSYLTAQTLHEIDRIKRHRHELVSQRPVAVDTTL